jgi:hypothetical protein
MIADYAPAKGLVDQVRSRGMCAVGQGSSADIHAHADERILLKS